MSSTAFCGDPRKTTFYVFQTTRIYNRHSLRRQHTLRQSMFCKRKTSAASFRTHAKKQRNRRSGTGVGSSVSLLGFSFAGIHIPSGAWKRRCQGSAVRASRAGDAKAPLRFIRRPVFRSTGSKRRNADRGLPHLYMTAVSARTPTAIFSSSPSRNKAAFRMTGFGLSLIIRRYRVLYFPFSRISRITFSLVNCVINVC